MFVSLYWFTNADIALFSVDSIAVDMKDGTIIMIGEADPVSFFPCSLPFICGMMNEKSYLTKQNSKSGWRT